MENSVIDEMFVFETLNFVPIEKSLIEKGLMSADEIVWLNEYHSECRQKIREYLEPDEKIWLDQATEEIK